MYVEKKKETGFYVRINTVGENSIATIKLRKYFWCSLKMLILPILQLCDSKSWRSHNSWKSDNLRESHQKRSKKLIPKRMQ